MRHECLQRVSTGARGTSPAPQSSSERAQRPGVRRWWMWQAAANRWTKGKGRGALVHMHDARARVRSTRRGAEVFVQGEQGEWRSFTERPAQLGFQPVTGVHEV